MLVDLVDLYFAATIPPRPTTPPSTSRSEDIAGNVYDEYDDPGEAPECGTCPRLCSSSSAQPYAGRELILPGAAVLLKMFVPLLLGVCIFRT